MFGHKFTALCCHVENYYSKNAYLRTTGIAAAVTQRADHPTAHSSSQLNTTPAQQQGCKKYIR